MSVRLLLTIAALAAVQPAPLVAQDLPHALKVAAEYVLQADNARGPILVDVDLAFPERTAPASPALRGHATALAAMLKQETVRLASVMTCPGRNPTPEEFSSQEFGCRLSEDVGTVLHLSRVETTDSGYLLTITTFRQVTNSRGTPHCVGAHSLDLAVDRVKGREKWKIASVTEAMGCM